jgi:hypothetical protein
MKTIAVIKGNPFVLNAFSLLIFAASYLLVFKLLWDIRTPQGVDAWSVALIAISAVIFPAVHEFIHMLIAMFFVRRAQVSIHVKVLVVECRVHSYLTRDQYICYAVGPALVLASVGLALYYISSSVDGRFLSSLLFLGGLSSGGGDFWFVSQILRYPGTCDVMDKGMEMEIVDMNGV